MNKQELIEKYEYEVKLLRLQFGEIFKVKVYEELLDYLKQLDEPEPIKLRDVITRIKQLDIGTRKVWLDEFLNELGSDYETLKYKDGYEQGKVEGLIECEKPVVKQFVADWYEDNKDDLEFNIWDWIKYTQEEEKIQNRQFTEWLGGSDNDPIETLVKMKLFGYEVEKEKRYLVKMKGMDKEFTILKLDKIRGSWYLGNDTEYSYTKTTPTRKELEEAGFGEVFDSPLFEVEEVEE